MVGTNEAVIGHRQMCREMCQAMAAGLPHALARMYVRHFSSERIDLSDLSAAFAESRGAEDNDGIVYFIRCGDAVKVGFTTNLTQRYMNLQAMNPAPIWIYGAISGTVVLEQEVLWRLRAHHMHGEWLHWNDEVKASVDAIVPAAIREQYNG